MPEVPRYDVTALPVTIWFNKDGDHDHNGMVFALTANVPILKYIEALGKADRPGGEDPPDALRDAAAARAAEIGVHLPVSPAQAREPHPLVRPLVLRARLHETVEATLRNEIRGRRVGLHLVGDGYDVREHDGSQVGLNLPGLVRHPDDPPPVPDVWTYRWTCGHEGVFPFHDGGNHSGGEDGTNVHGLFGALIVEPPGATWRDPVTGRGSHGNAGTGPFVQLDGLYLDVLPEGTRPDDVPESTTTLDDHDWGTPRPCFQFDKTPHREFVIVFHDEPEFVPPHGHLEPDPCDGGGDGNGGDGGGHAPGCGRAACCCCAPKGHGHPSVCRPARRGGHGRGRRQGGAHGGGAHDGPPIMTVSYRSEPMANRERRLWRLLRTGHDFKGRPVLNEEQHHSSWMFGDPATPVLKAYTGDPVRIRFVHAGVKETHVFHLHLYEWHAAAGNEQSPRIDAISVSPQTAHTIEPVWGAGNRQQVAGDVIWHCHLYPHFHEGMWGMFRTFETRQDGEDGPLLADQGFPYTGRRIGRYPDGTRVEKLLPLPKREAPPLPTAERPGYPLYIPGETRQKSPVPPWPDRPFEGGEAPPPYVASLLAADMPHDFDYRPVPTALERNAFNPLPVPGELFTRNPTSGQQAAIYADASHDDHARFVRNGTREVAHDVAVAMRGIAYNSHGWHDKHGHLYYLEAEGDPATRAGPMEPLFLRARHGQIVNVVLRNATPEAIEETEFDHAFPPCPALPWEGECAAHVHMVKFDPICADGASTGWNYISGARHGRRMVYRWWADREFGTIFFHDHLFANHRQKHGLFGALLVEPAGSKFFHHVEPDREILTGLRAMVVRHEEDPERVADAARRGWFREFCVGIGDFIPMWNRAGEPLNPPAEPGGHGDQGVMGINYRNAPVRERPGDPAHWFSSGAHGDPDTTVFNTYEGDPVWIRIVQGSHEEQHSFQVHGLRWRRFREQADSAVRNQQSFGIAEAFTFINEPEIGPGDHMYKLSGADDLWLGCWGLVRALPAPDPSPGTPFELPVPEGIPRPSTTVPAMPAAERRFRVRAEQQRLAYRSDIVDPFGLVYRLTEVRPPGGAWKKAGPPEGAVEEPLVLWCREGETVVVELTNGIVLAPGADLEPEPHAPEVPLERPDPPGRPVSSQVSMHADLVRYDVRAADGANAGLNPVQTVPPGATRTYEWDTSRPTGGREPLGPVLLQDMADFRNHRHHGLIGALVVLPADAAPHEVGAGQPTADATAAEVWHGARVTVVGGSGSGTREEHMVLLMQDGLRLFMKGAGANFGIPLPDPPDVQAGEAEKEDQGQKGFNYRTEPIGPDFDPQGNPYTRLRPDPATPIVLVPKGAQVRLHLVGACDKPRHHSFTVHGVAWPEHRFMPPGALVPWVSSESAISCGTVRTFAFEAPAHAGSHARDHAYRSGMLRWDVPQGMWGIMRVV